MAVLKSSHEQAAKMYSQLLNMLEEMALQASEDDEPLDEMNYIQSIVEESEERGLDSEIVERIFKNVALMRKRAKGE